VRILAVAHPVATAIDHAPYAELVRRGVDVHLVLPDGAPDHVPTELGGHGHRLQPTFPRRWIRRLHPDVVLVDVDAASATAARWVHAARRARVPVAVAAGAGGDGWPTRAIRDRTLRRTGGVIARTPAAARRARHSGARGPVELVPPAVLVPDTVMPPTEGRAFTIGFAGRLEVATGISDLLTAIDRLPRETRLLVATDGPLRPDVVAHPKVDLRRDVRRIDMGPIYAEMDVLVLPSGTPPSSPERLGPVLLDAMAHARPVLAAASGELPWVLGEARGGMTFPEGDIVTLATLLVDVREDATRWRALGAQGRADVVERFSAETSADALLDLAARLHAEGPR
jgi:glycosyltransferase involved in cell wall biosynthesis